MSEQQKIFASLSGAVVVHLILLLVIFLLLSTKSIGSSLKGAQAAENKGPKEVTVLMSELMEQIEVERIKAEPPVPAQRPFISTDLNQAEAVVPKNARFESDRNTSAAAETKPDENLPKQSVPTLDGDSPLPHLTLQNRQFVEGQLNKAQSAPALPGVGPATSGAAAASALPADQNSLPAANADAPPGKVVEEQTDGATSDREKGEVKGVKLADGASEAEGDSPETTFQRSFVVPSIDPLIPTLGKIAAEEERFAAKDGKINGEKEMTESVAEKAPAPSMKAGEVSSPGSPPAAPAEPSEAGSLNPADEGLFDKSFSPEERKNAINGSLAKAGMNAVDAEGTAMGRYKKTVKDLIAVKWNRYRQDKADFVSWGILKLQFCVDTEGKVKDLQITKNESNAVLVEFTLKAIREADLPPMPEDVAKSVGPRGMVIQYDIIIY